MARVLRQRSVQIRQPMVATPRRSIRLTHGSGGDFSPDSGTLLLKTTSGRLSVVDHGAPTAVPQTLALGYGEGSAPRFSRCGRFIIDASWSGWLVVLDAHTGAYVEHREFPADMLVEIMAAGDRWMVRHSPRATTETEPPAPDFFSLWPVPLSKVPERVLRPGLRFVRCSALSSNGDVLALCHGAPPVTLSVIETSTLQTVAEGTVEPGTEGGMAWAPSGELAVVERDCIRVYSRALKVLAELNLRYACDVAFSPGGGLVAAGSWEDGRVLEVSELLT